MISFGSNNSVGIINNTRLQPGQYYNIDGFDILTGSLIPQHGNYNIGIFQLDYISPVYLCNYNGVDILIGRTISGQLAYYNTNDNLVYNIADIPVITDYANDANNVYIATTAGIYRYEFGSSYIAPLGVKSPCDYNESAAPILYVSSYVGVNINNCDTLWTIGSNPNVTSSLDDNAHNNYAIKLELKSVSGYSFVKGATADNVDLTGYDYMLYWIRLDDPNVLTDNYDTSGLRLYLYNNNNCNNTGWLAGCYVPTLKSGWNLCLSKLYINNSVSGNVLSIGLTTAPSGNWMYADKSVSIAIDDIRLVKWSDISSDYRMSAYSPPNRCATLPNGYYMYRYCYGGVTPKQSTHYYHIISNPSNKSAIVMSGVGDKISITAHTYNVLQDYRDYIDGIYIYAKLDTEEHYIYRGKYSITSSVIDDIGEIAEYDYAIGLPELLDATHDIPPTATKLYMHNSRLYCYGLGAYRTDNIHVSSRKHYNYYPTTTVYDGDPSLGYIIDNIYTKSSQIMTMTNYNNILLCYGDKEVVAIQGDSIQDLDMHKLIDIGCIAPKSVCNCITTVIWLAHDGFMMFGDNGINNISQNKIDITKIDINYPIIGYYANNNYYCYCYYDNNYTILIYNMINNCWTTRKTIPWYTILSAKNYIYSIDYNNNVILWTKQYHTEWIGYGNTTKTVEVDTGYWVYSTPNIEGRVCKLHIDIEHPSPILISCGMYIGGTNTIQLQGNYVLPPNTRIYTGNQWYVLYNASYNNDITTYTLNKVHNLNGYYPVYYAYVKSIPVELYTIGYVDDYCRYDISLYPESTRHTINLDMVGYAIRLKLKFFSAEYKLHAIYYDIDIGDR